MGSIRREIARCASVALAVVAVVVAAPAPPARAAAIDLEFKDCAFDEGLGNGECQHFLRNPAGATDDPCWCDKCRNGAAGQHHDGHTIPPGWNPTLFESGGMDAYLKRHSLAWGITCSDCMVGDKPWPDGAAGKIGTVPELDFAGRNAKDAVFGRLAKEKSIFKKAPGDVIVAYSKHFYLVTDISGLKVRTPGGTERAITTHEWAHLTLERAEYARREWERTLGEPDIKKPIAIFAIEKQRDVERFNATYFGGANSDALTGGGDHVCEGFCNSGLSMSHSKNGDDTNLQIKMRHMLAHCLFTCWATHEIRPHSLLSWMEEGLGHWLSRTLPRLRDDATFCMGEAASSTSSAPSWSGKGWEDDVAKYATGGKLSVIEEFMAIDEIGHFKEMDHKRSWSYCDLCLSEWREPFVKLLAALRQETNVREAFMSTLGVTPEVFDQRWRDRVTGRRKSMGPLPNDPEADAGDTPGARDRRQLRAEADPQALAAKVRALGEVTDKKTIPVVMDVMAKTSDLVRETALVTLLKTKQDDCLEALWTYGLSHTDAIVRAYAAKLCARLHLDKALPKLEEQLGDKNWYARAEAAVACGMMKDAKAMSAMRKIVTSDTSDKAKMGAMDALAMFGEDAGSAVPLIAKGLESAQWQIRIASTEALGEIGSMEGVEPLVARMEVESGRVREDIYEALKKISRDDLGRKPESWRSWWTRMRANSPNGVPRRPDAPDAKKKPQFDPNDPHATHDGGPPPYFGVEIYSNRIAFVVDTTQTMLTLFTPDPAGAKALSREYTGRNKLEICKEEIAQALGALDPRAHFNIVAFGMQIRPFKQNPVPANKANIEAAIGFLRSLPGVGRTNYYGALKAALDIGDEPDTNPDFRATPDTITFLTDGLPNEGDIQDADTLVEWYTGLNRYARVKTHTITFGDIDIDRKLLKGLAERNGGKYTEVPEKARR